MKYFALFALLAIGASALPTEVEPMDARVGVVVDRIYAAIQRIRSTIQLLGLDPVNIDSISGSYELPVPVIFSAGGAVENLRSFGLSNIVINQMAYDVLNFALTFDFRIPQIHFSTDAAAGEILFFGEKYTGAASGSLDIRDIKVAGIAHISLLGGSSITQLAIDSGIANIDSALQIKIQNRVLSDRVNNFLNDRVLDTLTAFKSEVDELLSIVIKDYLNNNILG